ncbi:MAG TPA: dihydrodipicolinate synthase family protein [Dongiaceae bacterium]|jgi:4-hydroxy-tetrahydrodipicolinate synthase|nr:dihydrodipicolinate synthase family protein [Dongiaceae bacterium]
MNDTTVKTRPAAAGQTFRGVLSPALTPFTADLEPDRPAFVGFCNWLLEQGANGLAVFGTTSEANSLSQRERMSLLEHLVEKGIPAARLMPGTGASNLPDAVELTRHALELGAGGVLVLPPFYYKNMPEDGIYAYYAAIVDRVARPDLKLYLYHIPQMSGVAITPSLIARLRKAYGGVIAGLKDSSGVWDNVAMLLKEFPEMAIFPASEKFLLAALKLGAAGCISATANYQVANIRKLIDTPDGEARVKLDGEVGRIRSVFESYPLVPALKAAIAAVLKNPSWRIVRPPFAQLPEDKRRELLGALGLQ